MRTGQGHTLKESQRILARRHSHSSPRRLLSSWTGHVLLCSPLWMQGGNEPVLGPGVKEHLQMNKPRQSWRQGHGGGEQGDEKAREGKQEKKMSFRLGDWGGEGPQGV